MNNDGQLVGLVTLVAGTMLPSMNSKGFKLQNLSEEEFSDTDFDNKLNSDGSASPSSSER